MSCASPHPHCHAFTPSLVQVVPRGFRPQDASDDFYFESAPPGLEALMGRCWATDPRDRPTAAAAAAELAVITDNWVACLAADAQGGAAGLESGDEDEMGMGFH